MHKKVPVQVKAPAPVQFQYGTSMAFIDRPKDSKAHKARSVGIPLIWSSVEKLAMKRKNLPRTVQKAWLGYGAFWKRIFGLQIPRIKKWMVRSQKQEIFYDAWPQQASSSGAAVSSLGLFPGREQGPASMTASSTSATRRTPSSTWGCVSGSTTGVTGPVPSW